MKAQLKLKYDMKAQWVFIDVLEAQNLCIYICEDFPLLYKLRAQNFRSLRGQWNLKGSPNNNSI